MDIGDYLAEEVVGHDKSHAAAVGRQPAAVNNLIFSYDDDVASLHIVGNGVHLVVGRTLQAQSHQDAVHASGNDGERHLGDVCEQCQHVIQVSALAYVCYGFYGYGRKNVVGHHSRQF